MAASMRTTRAVDKVFSSASSLSCSARRSAWKAHRGPRPGETTTTPAGSVTPAGSAIERRGEAGGLAAGGLRDNVQPG